ncbi:MAG TPA: hypothetical protein VFL66_05505 [Gaiellaceae bacterium]|nr:hypothetical protein [Gaiellaceae bacterium]
MLEATNGSLFLDYFRIPYRPLEDGERRWHGLAAAHPLQGCGLVRGSGEDAPLLAWPGRAALGAAGAAPRQTSLREIPLFAAVLPDARLADWLLEAGGRWSAQEPLLDRRGRRVASIWREDGGSVLLPFDPGEAIEAFWSEAYKMIAASTSTRVKRAAGAGYYRVRPAIPRQAQIAARRLASRVQRRCRFPRWPLEPSLHDLYLFLFGLVGEVAREPVPWIAPWPGGHSWALVLTHDVETQTGYDRLELLHEIELESGWRSSWNFVPGRYRVDDEVVRGLTEAGFEVGVHGLYHDGRDVAPSVVDCRLPAMRAAAERWSAAGFRAPATRRDWRVMPRLGFDYDSSYPDTDPFEPDGGGCCTWLPFLNGETVELPITLPQDHTLFRILRHSDETLWLRKAEQLRDRGGLALLITHPDYMLAQPHRDAYRRFLAAFADDEQAWTPLPRELSAWWRRRAASRIERVEGRWQIVGPAAGEGRIAFAPGFGAG